MNNDLTPDSNNGFAFHRKVQLVRPVLPAFGEMREDIQHVLEGGIVTKGPYLRDFERAVADHLGVPHAVAVSSCTAGLMLAYRALNLTGDVVVPSFTFMATVSAMVWAGLRPVFVDVDPHTFNLDPTLVEQAITPRTSAIVAAHIFGNPGDIDTLEEIAARRGVKLIFDAAHGFGSLYRGAPVGSQGHVQAFSLSPTKLLIAGEGGFVTTNDDALAEALRVGREYGNVGNYDSGWAGMNARMPEINAIMGLRSLTMLETAAHHRNRIAELFREELGQLPGIGFQKIRAGDRSSYKDFSITVDESAFGMGRDGLADALAAANIDTRKYYDPPVHRQTAYRQYAPSDALPNTERLARQSLSLPLWSDMPEDMAYDICRAVRHAWQRGGSRVANTTQTRSNAGEKELARD